LQKKLKTVNSWNWATWFVWFDINPLDYNYSIRDWPLICAVA
jgi:hypothetical protein